MIVVRGEMPRKRLLDFRFGVGSSEGPSSGVWHAWNHRSDVYISHRGMGHIHKISIHPEPRGLCFYGPTSEYAKRHTQGRRNLIKWRRRAVAPSGSGTAARVVWAVFPTDYLGPGGIEPGEIHWIKQAPKGLALQIDVVFTRDTQAVLEAAFLTRSERKLEKYVRLPNGEAFALVSSVMSDWENRDVILRGGPDFRNVGFRAADQRGVDREKVLSFFPTPKDGGALHLCEVHGNDLQDGDVIAADSMYITGGEDGIRSLN